MNKFRQLLILIATALIVLGLTYIDYNNLAWEVNRSSYIGIISMIVGISSLILTNRKEKKVS